MRPTAAGRVMRNASRIPRASSERKEVRLPAAASRASSGSDTMPSATPNTPSGSCIRRNAIASQNVGPSPSCEANMEFTITFTCVELAAITDGPINCRIATTPLSFHWKSRPKRIAHAVQRGKLHEQLQRAADERAHGEPEQRALPEVRIEPPPHRHAADDGAEIEEARGHRRHAEHVARVQHPHHQRGERHQQDEGYITRASVHGERRLSRDRSPAREWRRATARRECRRL